MIDSKKLLDKEKIKKGIYIYGVYPALCLLRIQQELKNYENCQIIKESIYDVLDGRWYGITTDVTDEGLSKNLLIILSCMKDPIKYKDNLSHQIYDFNCYVGFND